MTWMDMHETSIIKHSISLPKSDQVSVNSIIKHFHIRMLHRVYPAFCWRHLIHLGKFNKYFKIMFSQRLRTHIDTTD